jgi:hypothetical protein
MGNWWCSACRGKAKKEEMYQNLDKENDIYADWLNSRRGSMVRPTSNQNTKKIKKNFKP